ncbi:hypothetical protein [Microbulbifer sp. TRSA005]|uniref:hypothetical protein n=1 Tax=Microbulbifer sp. TRSA005 TaxID=3243383 RepID=UPI00403975CB
MSAKERIRDINTLHQKHDISEEATLTVENFERPLAIYELPASVARCQFLRRGASCGREHQRGFVVLTKDSQRILIGHCCANKRLGLEHSGIKAQLNRLTKDVTRSEKEVRVRASLAKKEEYLSIIRASMKQIRVQQEAVRNFLAILPPKVASELIRRARVCDFSIVWVCYIHKKGKRRDEDETVSRHHTVGQLQGLECLLALDDMERHKDTLFRLMKPLMGVSLSKSPSKDELDKLDELLRQVANLKRVLQEVSNFERDVARFTRKKNLLLVAYAVRNHQHRAETLKAVAAYCDVRLGKSPKASFVDFERGLLQQYGAHSLRLRD